MVLLDVLREREERQKLELGRTRARGIKGRSYPVTEGQSGRGARRTDDQGGQVEEDSSYQAESVEEAGDGGPSVGFASRPLLTQEGECPPEAYKPAAPMDLG